MAWTPQDLTNPEFIKTQLTPLDRSNALLTMTQNLTRVQSKLEENKAALAQVQDQTNGPYSFGTVRDARNAASAAVASGAPDAAALQARYEELNAKRQDLNAQADTLLRAVQSGEDAVKTSQIGISNLEAAGAVPPGTNQFTPPPEYTKVNDTINPPQQVPDSSLPNANVNPNTDPNTNIGAEVQIAVQKTIPNGPTSAPYDELGNLNPGWGLYENNNPVWVEEGYIDANGTNVSAPQKTLPDSSPQGPSRDDNGNLMPGWNEDEFGTPYYVGNGFVAPATQASANATIQGITTNKAATQGDATNQDSKSFEKAKDWRVRLSLAPNAKYLYKADVPGILKPLQTTNGVIFPYTPTVSAVYAASYDASELVHSNYKIYNYKNSAVDTVTITGDFTAQDTNEANYLLAVIHFFKSVTKMFYGQDQNPRNGVPPPLVYMSGLGTFQFDNHPLAVTNFTYSLPNEVDYIRAGSTTNEPGSSTAGQTTVNNTDNASTARIQSSGLGAKIPNFQRQQATINSNATYVPTKMQIVITCIPIVTRNDISNNFSLRDYATGALLQGSKRNGGGIW
jgi:hypothetical protein